MALIKCHECGNNVSTEAAACPNCGAKPKPIDQLQPVKATPFQSAAILLVVGLVAWFFIHDSNDKAAIPATKDASTTTTAQATDVVGEQARTEAMEPPAAPTHYYSMQDGDSYGYESVLSQNDINNGVATKPLIMFKLVSKSDSKIVLKSETGDGIYSLISCEMPCEYVKIIPVINGYKQKSETMAVTSESIVNFAIQDAINGNMEAASKLK